MVAGGEGDEGQEEMERSDFKGTLGNFRRDEYIILIVLIVSGVYTNIKMHQSVDFKYVQFTIYQLYLKKAGKIEREKTDKSIKDRHLILDTKSFSIFVLVLW